MGIIRTAVSVNYRIAQSANPTKSKVFQALYGRKVDVESVGKVPRPGCLCMYQIAFFSCETQPDHISRGIRAARRMLVLKEMVF